MSRLAAERSSDAHAGPGVYTLANTITILPFLFACSVAFSLIVYWAIGLHEGADHLCVTSAVGRVDRS